MRVCIIGNSHVGALKRAWDSFVSEERDVVNITFFAVGSDGMKGVDVKGNCLVAGNDKLKSAFVFTSGGKAEIDPTEYDVFLLYGMFAKAFFKDDSKHYSKSAIDCALKDLVKDQLSFNVLIKLRSITNKKIYIGHNPFKAASESSKNVVHEGYLSGLAELNQRVYKDYNSEILPQPLSTIVNRKFTNIIFSRNSKKLATGTSADNELHPEQDNFHMNDEFGKLWLSAFIQLLLDQPSLTYT